MLLVAHTVGEDSDGAEIILIISARAADRKERKRHENQSRGGNELALRTPCVEGRLQVVGCARGSGAPEGQVLHSYFFRAFFHAFFPSPTHSGIVNIKCLRNLLHAVAARSVGLHDDPVARWHGCKPGQRRR